MENVAFELARELTARLAGMYNPGNYPGSKFSARTWGGRAGLSSARAVSGLFRGARAPVNRQLFMGFGSSRSRTSGYSGYKRRRVGKRSYRTGRLAGRYRSTQGRLNKELKNFDNLGGLNPGPTSTIVLPSSLATGALLVGIPQGTTASARTGRKIMVKKIQVKGQVVMSPGAGAIGTDIFKWWLVLDRQANGAYPSSIGDIFSSSTVGIEMRNLDTTHRYRVLEAGMLEFGTGAGVTGAYDSQIKQLDIEHNCNMLVEMSSTAGAITEIKSNNVLLLTGSMNGITNLVGSSRIRFYDQG